MVSLTEIPTEVLAGEIVERGGRVIFDRKLSFPHKMTFTQILEVFNARGLKFGKTKLRELLKQDDCLIEIKSKGTKGQKTIYKGFTVRLEYQRLKLI